VTANCLCFAPIPVRGVEHYGRPPQRNTPTGISESHFYLASGNSDENEHRRGYNLSRLVDCSLNPQTRRNAQFFHSRNLQFSYLEKVMETSDGTFFISASVFILLVRGYVRSDWNWFLSAWLWSESFSLCRWQHLHLSICLLMSIFRSNSVLHILCQPSLLLPYCPISMLFHSDSLFDSSAHCFFLSSSLQSASEILHLIFHEAPCDWIGLVPRERRQLVRQQPKIIPYFLELCHR
jgi:hypothetical protein